MVEFWLKEQGRERASKHALRILDKLETKFTLLDDPRPFVTSILIKGSDQDEHDYEVQVELAPGAVLAVRHRSADDHERQQNALDREGGAIARLVLQSVQDFYVSGFGVVADRLHDLRVRARKILADWSAQGTYAQLVDIRLVRTLDLMPAEDLTVEVRLRCLSERLRPSIEVLDVSSPDLIAAKLEKWRPAMDVRSAAQAALARQGADFMVDQLVLNALAPHGDVATALRRLVASQQDWLSETLNVFIQNGHIRCSGQDTKQEDPSFIFGPTSVSVYDVTRPASVLDSMIGRSVRSLVEHPVLSDDMIILDASSKSKNGMDYVKARFEQTRWLFCSASGRIWPMEG